MLSSFDSNPLTEGDITESEAECIIDIIAAEKLNFSTPCSLPKCVLSPTSMPKMRCWSSTLLYEMD